MAGREWVLRCHYASFLPPTIIACDNYRQWSIGNFLFWQRMLQGFGKFHCGSRLHFCFSWGRWLLTWSAFLEPLPRTTSTFATLAFVRNFMAVTIHSSDRCYQAYASKEKRGIWTCASLVPELLIEGWMDRLCSFIDLIRRYKRIFIKTTAVTCIECNQTYYELVAKPKYRIFWTLASKYKETTVPISFYWIA